jgi:hypothetical protein
MRKIGQDRLLQRVGGVFANLRERGAAGPRLGHIRKSRQEIIVTELFDDNGVGPGLHVQNSSLGCPVAQHRVENARPQFFGLNRRRSFFADPNHLVAAFAARGIHDKFLAMSLRPSSGAG